MQLIPFLAKRIFIEMPLALFVLITITFFLIRIAPGGPFSSEKNISPLVLKELEAHYQLDKPLPVQYLIYLKSIATGNFGPSFKYPGKRVSELVAEAFPVSLELGFYALLFAFVIGIPAGVIAASRSGTLIDAGIMSIGLAGICVPAFVAGPLLVLVFSVLAGWLPVAGWDTPLHRILPAITLGSVYLAYVIRLMRGSMMEVLNKEYIRAARARGLDERTILFRHAFRGAIIPVISFSGPAAAGLITGSFVVETIFAIPGLGRFFVMAAFNRDYTMIMGTVIFYGVIILTFNMIVDILVTFADPRIRSKK